MNSIRGIVAGLAIIVGYWAMPAPVQAAKLFVLPSTARYSTEQVFSVTLRVNTEKQDINAAQGVVSFDPLLIRVQTVSLLGSIFNLSAREPVFSNVEGTVRFAGVILNPGYTGTTGNLLTVTYKAVAQGRGTISFVSGRVFANDGQGTDLTTGMAGSTFTIGPEKATPSPAPYISSPASPLPLPQMLTWWSRIWHLLQKIWNIVYTWTSWIP